MGASWPKGQDRAIRSNLFCPPGAGKKGFPLYPLRGRFAEKKTAKEKKPRTAQTTRTIEVKFIICS
jgi:hypothetical protein